jgi:hypothetical protein
MGFRDILKIPELTRELASPGSKGLMVVLARLKELNAENMKESPINIAANEAIKPTARFIANKGKICEAPYMLSAIISTKRGGGILSSSLSILLSSF